MDQVKQILGHLKTYHFWILAVVTLVMVLATWFTVTAGLQKQTEDKTKEIEGKFSTGSTVRGKTDHPNAKSHEGMDGLLNNLKQDVLQAWQRQYEFQTGILVWPNELGEEFIRQVDPLRPIEILPPDTPISQEIRVEFREQYRDYIKQELPKLAKIVGAVWQATDTGGGGSEMGGAGMPGMSGLGGESSSGAPGMAGMPGMTGMPSMSGAPGTGAGTGKKRQTILVDWSADDQTRLQNLRFDWRMQQSKAPTTLQVLYAQEDLWVMNNLMMIIRDTNGDVEERYKAAIKRIDYIRLGADAIGRSGQVTRLTGGTGGGMGGSMGGSMGMPGMDGSSGLGSSSGGAMGAAMGAAGMGSSGGAMGAGPGMGMPSMPGAGGSTGSTGGTTATPDPANYRYVDSKLDPLTGDKLRNALKSKDRNDAFLVVAKRVPVRMRLTIDQRRINRLLTACGNSNLPLEIRQLRINRDSSGGGGGMGSGGGGYPSMGGSGMGSMPGMGGSMGSMPGMGGMSGMPGMGSMGGEGGESGMAGMPGMGSMMPGSGGGGMLRDDSPYDVPIELYGIVYIYNPVDMDKLGIEKAPPATEGTSEGTPAAPEASAGVPAQTGDKSS